MKFSIIIPTLNEEKLLPALLEQLNKLNQKDFDLEIIISDGGSKDKTLAIAGKYALLIVKHQSAIRQNIAMGRNAGAAAASGEILIFLNGDVILSDEHKFFYFIRNNFAESKYLAMTCFVRVFPWEEKLIDKLYHYGYNGYFKFLNTMGIGMGRGECQIIRKSVFDKMNGYNETLAAGEDFDLFRRIKKTGDILYTDKVVVFESPRRYRKIGYAGVTWSWVKNGFSVFLKNKSISKEWEQVR